MTITPDQERWGVAMAVVEQHGDDAMVHAIERMRHFAAKFDRDGMRFWLDISRRIHQLAKAEGELDH